MDKVIIDKKCEPVMLQVLLWLPTMIIKMVSKVGIDQEWVTYYAPTPTVTSHNDDDNGGESMNRPEMGTFYSPNTTTTNNTHPF